MPFSYVRDLWNIFRKVWFAFVAANKPRPISEAIAVESRLKTPNNSKATPKKSTNTRKEAKKKENRSNPLTEPARKSTERNSRREAAVGLPETTILECDVAVKGDEEWTTVSHSKRKKRKTKLPFDVNDFDHGDQLSVGDTLYQVRKTNRDVFCLYEVGTLDYENPIHISMAPKNWFEKFHITVDDTRYYFYWNVPNKLGYKTKSGIECEGDLTLPPKVSAIALGIYSSLKPAPKVVEDATCQTASKTN